jgi:hypothetical protein
MAENRKQRLIDLVKRLIATPGEIVHRFKKRLVSLKRSKRVIDWSKSPELSGSGRSFTQLESCCVSQSVIVQSLI